MFGIGIFWWIFGISYIIISILSYYSMLKDDTIPTEGFHYFLSFTPFVNHTVVLILIAYTIVESIKNHRKKKSYKKIRGRVVSPLDPYGEENWEK